jgi:hypothetical protein
MATKSHILIVRYFMKPIALILFFCVLTFAEELGRESQMKILGESTYYRVPSGFSRAPVTREDRKALAAERLALETIKSKERIEIAKIEAESRQSVARTQSSTSEMISRIEAQSKAQETEALRQQSQIERDVALAEQESSREIALAGHENVLAVQQNALDFYEILMWLGAGLLVIILAFVYLLHWRNRATEVALQQERLQHEAMLQASAQHHDKVSKLLDIVSRQDIDQGTKSDLLALLEEQEKLSRRLLPFLDSTPR